MKPSISRRDVLALLGVTVMVPRLRPREAKAQQPMPVIGWLSTNSPDADATRLAVFRQSLKDRGFVEGQNVAIEYRWAEGQREKVTALAADLIGRRVTMILATGATDPARAAKAATSTIPIVFATGGDPVLTGLVPSLARPGGNLTGVTWLANDSQAKRLELLRDLLPSATSIAYLQNPMNFSLEREARDIEAAARALAFQVIRFNAATIADIDVAFSSMAQQRFDALAVQAEPLFTTRRDQVIELAIRARLPAIYGNAIFPARGGLMSYSADINDAFRQAGLYAGRILKGAKPADLPVLQPTRFEFVINRKTAKALGLTFPPSFELRATEVIE